MIQNRQSVVLTNSAGLPFGPTQRHPITKKVKLSQWPVTDHRNSYKFQDILYNVNNCYLNDCILQGISSGSSLMMRKHYMARQERRKHSTRGKHARQARLGELMSQLLQSYNINYCFKILEPFVLVFVGQTYCQSLIIERDATMPRIIIKKYYTF